jgi:flagellin
MTTISAGSAFYKVQAALDDNSNKVAKSMERLATGRRGVTAGDRPASTVIAGNTKNNLASIKIGIQNLSEAMQVIEVLNNDIKSLQAIMTRVQELNTLGENGLNSAADIVNIELEADDLVLEFAAIQANSKWGAKALFGGVNKAVNFGLNQNTMSFGSTTVTRVFDSTEMGTGVGDVNIATDLAAVDAQQIVIADQFVKATNKMTLLTSLAAGYALDVSSKLDVDFAAETTELAKGQILAQAGTAMLAQANAQGQGMLALIQS